MNLGRKLQEWTGQVWKVEITEQEGGPTLKENRTERERSEIEDAEKIPVVADILKTWPGAKITKVKNLNQIESGSVEPSAEMARKKVG